MDVRKNIFIHSFTFSFFSIKEELLSYEEFAELKDTEGEQRVQATEMIGVSGDVMDEIQDVVISEKVDSEIIEMEEAVSEKVVDIPEKMDDTKLSIEERAALLPVPTDDYEAEYDAYCQRMGYTVEKMKSIRYKMAVYDEFLEEYQYRSKYYGVRDDSRRIAISEKNRGARDMRF